ncbi:MAG: aldehyde dehydrogenase family protein [Fidelibacterota bacterium]
MTSSTTNTLDSINPVNGQVIDKVTISTQSKIDEQLSRIEEALPAWQSKRLVERAAALRAVRKVLIARMDEIMDLVRLETGKTEFDGIVEVLTTAEIMRFVEKEGPLTLATQRRSSGFLLHKRARVEYRPHGIVGVISPWNYPLILAAGPVVQALMAGNGVILKPSEFVPLTALKLKEIFLEAGFPQGLLQVAIGAADAGKMIVESPQTKLICFTGSVSVGRKIATACAHQLKPVIIELGGKDAMIVLEDAYLERAARAAVWGGFQNAGQTCISVERIYVEEGIADQFVERVQELTEGIALSSEVEDGDLGPVINPAQKEKIKALLTEVGAAETTKSENLFIRPQVITEPAESSKLMMEETFGPIITVHTVKDHWEAVKKVNALNYGLNTSIFSEDLKKAREMTREIKSGNVVINDVLTNYLCVNLPFGGVGLSGLGRLQGKEGIRSFTFTQSILEDRFGLKKEPWWFPVSPVIKKLFRRFLRFYYG